MSRIPHISVLSVLVAAGCAQPDDAEDTGGAVPASEVDDKRLGGPCPTVENDPSDGCVQDEYLWDGSRCRLILVNWCADG